MKILFPTIALLMSFAALADQSDFERGFYAGQNSCKQTPTTLVVCKITGHGNYSDIYTSGATKAEALSKVDATTLSSAIYHGLNNIDCTTFHD